MSKEECASTRTGTLQLDNMKIRDLVNSVCLISFSALAVLSLILHALTFVGYDPREMSAYLWYGLQFSSAFALILALLTFGIKEKISPLPPNWSLDKFLGLCVFVFTIYGIFNFLFTDMVLLHGASPEIINGQYVTGSHGFYTLVSKESFMKALVYQARLHSGHWMAFFLFAITALRWKATNVSNK